MCPNWKTLLPLSVTAAIFFNACQGTAIDNKESSAKSDTTSVISEFQLQESILTASESYRITSSDEDSTVYYLSLSSSVQWPESLGKHKIQALRDTIISIAFGPTKYNDIRNAIKASVTDVSQFGLGDKIERIESVPDSIAPNELYSNRTVQMVECTEQTVTYSAAWSEYLGGAHPNSGATPFTFVLASDSIVNMNYLFKPGAEKKLLPKILESLAMNYSMSVEELNNALLNSPTSVTGNVYILNNTIVFHYNPYDILPYSYGASDAYIIPYEVADLLTPQAKKLLLD